MNSKAKKMKPIVQDENGVGAFGVPGKNVIHNVYFATTGIRRFDSDGLVLPRKMLFPQEVQLKKMHGELMEKHKTNNLIHKQIYSSITEGQLTGATTANRPCSARSISSQLEEQKGKLRKPMQTNNQGNGEIKSELMLVYERICLKDRHL